MRIDELRSRFDDLEDMEVELTELDEFQENVHQLEQDVFDAINSTDPIHQQEFIGLADSVAALKNKYNFYNADDELDRLFPNGQDDG